MSASLHVQASSRTQKGILNLNHIMMKYFINGNSIVIWFPGSYIFFST
jgi:hypothetical protein